jgi:hypothetical protein
MTPIDPISEMLALLSCGNNKSLLIPAIETEGHFDEEAGRLAVQRAAKRFPHFGSPLLEVRDKGLFRLVRNAVPIPSIPVMAADISGELATMPAPDSFLRHLAPRLDRDWDLFAEPPAEIHFLKLSSERHLIVPVIHHVAGDASTIKEFGREFLINYHEIVKGERVDRWLADGERIRRKRPLQDRKQGFREFTLRTRKTLRQFRDPNVLPEGTGRPGDTRQFHIKRMLSEEETGRLYGLSAKKGVAVVDLMTAAANVAIDKWNEYQGISPGLLSTAVSVDLRARYPEISYPNASSLLFFRSFPGERSDLDEFTRRIAGARINQLRNQNDLKYTEDVARLCRILSVFPFRFRRRILDFMSRGQHCPLFIIMLGALWPGSNKRRSCDETALIQVGDLIVREIHAVGYKLCSEAPPTYILYLFNGRLNLMLSAAACHFTKSEAEAFMDLTLQNAFR